MTKSFRTEVRALALGVALCATAGLPALAETPALDAWRAELDALPCGQTEPAAQHYSDAALLLIALSWGEVGAEELQSWVEGGFTDYLDRGGDFDRVSNADAWTDFFLAQMEPARERFHDEAQGLGAALCPMVTLIAHADLATYAIADREKPLRYRTHVEFAQRILADGHCLDGEIDGAFGPISRVAWNRAVGGNAGLTLGSTARPTPGKVVELARSAMSGPLCAPIPKAPRSTSEALLSVAAACLEGRYPDSLFEQLSSYLEAAAYVGDVSGAMSRLTRECPDEGWTEAPQWGPLIERIEAIPSGAASDDAQYFKAARDSGEGATDLAHRYLQQEWMFSPAYDASPLPDGSTMRMDFTLTFEGVVTVTRIATLAARWPEVSKLVLREAPPEINFSVGTLILEGYAEAEKTDATIATAMRHIAAAAEAGLPMAQLRLAQAYEQGYGVAADLPRARTLYLKAAEAGQPEAMLRLAEIYERGLGVTPDWTEAERWYSTALGGGPDGGEPVVIALDRMRVAAASGRPFFTEGPGRALVDDLQTRLLDWSAKQDYQFEDPEDWGREIGRSLIDPASGIAPDFARAADWLRFSIDDASKPENAKSWFEGLDPRAEDRALLAHLLTAHPDLAKPGEVAALLDGTLEGAWLANPDPAALAQRIASDCAYDDAVCVAFQHRAALGGVAPELIAPAYHWLEAAAAEETEWLASPYTEEELQMAYGGLPRRKMLAGVALMDVRAFFGDWQGARAAIAPAPRFADMRLFSARDTVFHRTVSRIVKGGTPADLAGFTALLSRLALFDDEQARGFLEIATKPAQARPDSSNITLDEARRAFAIAEPLGRQSHGLGFAARRLSALEAQAGNAERATELELIAMGSDLAAADTEEVIHGALAADLTRVCAWSGASERLWTIGQADMALALARRAVNTLQSVRARLNGLPEGLQLCFRDQVSDHYRWLADLLIRQGQPAEADRVLTMLKGYETARFASHDNAVGGDQLALLPEPEGADGLIGGMAAVAPTVTEQALQRRELLILDQKRGLDAKEKRQLASLEEDLGRLAEGRRAVVSALIRASEQVGHEDAAARLGTGKSIKRHLRSLSGRQAAALQYVVLPDRIGLILTTPVSQGAYVIDRFDGKPLTAKALDAAIADFREALRNPGSDPRAASRKLEALLFPAELKAELKAGSIDTLVLSPDGPLRYIPFAALWNGEHWLVEDYALSVATEAPTGPDPEPLGRIAAFGTTRGISGFAPLPGVQREVDALVQAGPGDEGLLPGRALFDDDFTRSTLARGLVFGDAFDSEFGIVHIASHFDLAETEEDSFLLLGDGGKLSVSDLRAGFGIDIDFTEVGLLTLSACETAYGLPGADGSELESFAAIAEDQGARAVAATLWPVADGATAAFMEEFYARQTRGAPLDLALAETQRAFLSNAPPIPGLTLRSGAQLRTVIPPPPAFPGVSHPFFWAPVTLLTGAS